MTPSCRWNGSRRWLAVLAMASLAAGACERRIEQPASASTEWQEFEGSWNAAGSRRDIPLGADRKGSTIDLRGTMLLTGAGRPGLGFRAEIIALVDTDTGLVGRGVWTDEHGDEVYSEITGEGTRESNHIVGSILGGSGRYGGVTGSFEFSWEFVIEGGDGSIQGRAVGLKGRYRMAGVERP